MIYTARILLVITNFIHPCRGDINKQNPSSCNKRVESICHLFCYSMSKGSAEATEGWKRITLYDGITIIHIQRRIRVTLFYSLSVFFVLSIVWRSVSASVFLDVWPSGPLFESVFVSLLLSFFCLGMSFSPCYCLFFCLEMSFSLLIRLIPCQTR